MFWTDIAWWDLWISDSLTICYFRASFIAARLTQISARSCSINCFVCFTSTSSASADQRIQTVWCFCLLFHSWMHHRPGLILTSMSWKIGSPITYHLSIARVTCIYTHIYKCVPQLDLLLSCHVFVTWKDFNDENNPFNKNMNGRGQFTRFLSQPQLSRTLLLITPCRLRWGLMIDGHFRDEFLNAGRRRQES